MIYFDNAATGGFKPYSVIEATTNAIKYLSANPGRSGHRLSVAGATLVYKCRKELADLFNLPVLERVIFTKNCTEALNTAIFGTAKKGHVITTVYEHNSVLRPLVALKERGLIQIDYVKNSENKSLKDAVKEKIKDDTYLVVVNNVSNVTGEENDVLSIGKMIKSINKDILFLVDGAQSAGHIPIDMKESKIDMLCVAGHKGLYGIMGGGALLFNEDVTVKPLTFGGTGTESFSITQPSSYPEMLESGTLNLPAIVSMTEGAIYVKKNVETFGLILYDMSSILIESLKKLDRVTVYSTPNRSGIVAFSIDNVPSSAVADILSSTYEIAVRGGLHCAPLIHKHLGTEKDGLVRVSLAPQNTIKEIQALVKAVTDMTVS